MVGEERCTVEAQYQGFRSLPGWRPDLLKERLHCFPLSPVMKRYFTNRLLLFVPTLIGSLTLVFFLIHFIPGDPVEVMLGETASGADKEALRQELGLNQPLGIQYIRFFSALLQGDLGHSLYEQGTVESSSSAASRLRWS